MSATDDDMLTSLQQWWQRHSLALSMTSTSNHKAIGVAISALEQSKPFPTMQVILDGPAGVEKYVSATQRVFELETKLAKVRDLAVTDLPVEYERAFLDIIDSVEEDP